MLFHSPRFIHKCCVNRASYTWTHSCSMCSLLCMYIPCQLLSFSGHTPIPQVPDAGGQLGEFVLFLGLNLSHIPFSSSPPTSVLLNCHHGSQNPCFVPDGAEGRPKQGATVPSVSYPDLQPRAKASEASSLPWPEKCPPLSLVTLTMYP